MTCTHLNEIRKLEGFLRLKQNDWVDACKEVDHLKTENSLLRAALEEIEALPPLREIERRRIARQVLAVGGRRD